MHIKREYEPGDIEGYELVFVATDDRDENRNASGRKAASATSG